MPVNRRRFLLLSAGSALAYKPLATSADAMSRWGFKAVAFDAFPIFDPRPVTALAESLYPGKGSALTNAWRIRQFEYQWLRTLSGRYADFLQVTESSLLFATEQLQLALSEDKRVQLMSAWSNLRVWPDVPEAVETLHRAGLRLVFLSNMTASALNGGIKQAGLEGMFEAVLSADQIQSYKPEPHAYQMAVDRLQLRREEILFVAFAGWDVAGAKWFGYPTFWVNRLNAPPEELGVEADASGQDLKALVRFALKNGSVNHDAGAVRKSFRANGSPA